MATHKRLIGDFTDVHFFDHIELERENKRLKKDIRQLEDIIGDYMRVCESLIDMLQKRRKQMRYDKLRRPAYISQGKHSSIHEGYGSLGADHQISWLRLELEALEDATHWTPTLQHLKFIVSQYYKAARGVIDARERKNRMDKIWEKVEQKWTPAGTGLWNALRSKD